MAGAWFDALLQCPVQHGKRVSLASREAKNFSEPDTPLTAYFENDFSPLMRCAGEHLVSGAHIVQRQEGAYLRGQPSTVKQPRNAVQPFRAHLRVEKY